MKVLVIRPKEPPVLREVKPGLKSLQEIVGGYIEAIYPFDDPVAIVCNEEGKINGLEKNRALYDNDGKPYDIIYGTFFICGLGEENFADIPEKLIGKYQDMFRCPELFVKTDHGYMIVRNVRRSEWQRE